MYQVSTPHQALLASAVTHTTKLLHPHGAFISEARQKKYIKYVACQMVMIAAEKNKAEKEKRQYLTGLIH